MAMLRNKSRTNAVRLMKAGIAAFALSTTSLALAEPKQPDSGPGDCYNRATQTCNRLHPGKDMGDDAYRQCIDDHLDWCDENEPARDAGSVLPPLDLDGRFVDAKSGGKGETMPDRGRYHQLRCVEIGR